MTAARTKLINDELERWITTMKAGGTKVQVTNLGCGQDTRAFWVDVLANAERYVEVDDLVVNTAKNKILEELKEEPKCPR